MKPELPKNEKKKGRKQELLIAVLLLLFGAYGLRQVMAPEQWISATIEPKTANLEEPVLSFPTKPSDDEVVAAATGEMIPDDETILASQLPGRRVASAQASGATPMASTSVPLSQHRTPAALFTLEDSPETRKNRYGSISITPKFTYTRIDSTDITSNAAASFISNLNVGMDFSWAQHWSDFFETNFHAGFLKQSYLTDANSLKTVQNSDHALSNIGFGMKFTKFVDFLINFDMKQKDFIHATSGNTLVVEAVALPQASFGIAAPLLELQPFTLGVYANYAYLFSGKGISYTINSGSAYDAGVMLGQTINQQFSIGGKFWYGETKQNTSIATQIFKEVGMSFGLTYRFNKEETP